MLPDKFNDKLTVIRAQCNLMYTVTTEYLRALGANDDIKLIHNILEGAEYRNSVNSLIKIDIPSDHAIYRMLTSYLVAIKHLNTGNIPKFNDAWTKWKIYTTNLNIDPDSLLKLELLKLQIKGLRYEK